MFCKTMVALSEVSEGGRDRGDDANVSFSYGECSIFKRLTGMMGFKVGGNWNGTRFGENRAVLPFLE